MRMRDRMIEVIQDTVGGCDRYWAERIADALIDKGAVMFPCRIDQTVYGVVREDGEVSVKDFAVDSLRLEYHPKGNVMVIELIGHSIVPVYVDVDKYHRYFHDTREDAEKALAQMEVSGDE